MSGKFMEFVWLLGLAGEANTKSEASTKLAAAAGEHGGNGSSCICSPELDWETMSSFMKRGGCKESFIAWDKCIEDAHNDNEAVDFTEVWETCWRVGFALHKCMQAHSDHYEPVLQMQKAGTSFMEVTGKFKDAQLGKSWRNFFY